MIFNILYLAINFFLQSSQKVGLDSWIFLYWIHCIGSVVPSSTLLGLNYKYDVHAVFKVYNQLCSATEFVPIMYMIYQ